MKIHEYQAMSLFDKYGINTVQCELTDRSDNAGAIAEKLGGKVVVKAQILVGGRGKAGGVKLARTPEEARKAAEKILSMEIKSEPVKKVLVAQAVEIQGEYYLGITVDRALKRIVFIATSAGGVDIEELAEKSPEKVYKMYVDPLEGPDETELRSLAQEVFENHDLFKEACDTMLRMYRLLIEKDCSLVEINPYVKVSLDGLVAVDAKINFDDNGVVKHPDIEELRNPEEYSADEIRAQEADLSFVSMDGNIGCIVNGAGLAMATMDIIKLFGGEPANFLDVGGSSNPAKVLNALKIILSSRKVKAILINIFGGITRCDDIANGIIMATKQIDINVPLIIRLIGTNETEGRDILKKAGFVVAEEMTEAVKKAVESI
ncbi:MAG: ADP-forming succinate--CoA ligase subunit beta [Candidatus Omnitrophota bacterium]